MDKLYIDGKLYTVDNLESLPTNLQPQNRCHKQSENVFVFFSKHSIFSNFHPLPSKVQGETFHCNEQFFQRSKALFFGDEVTAEKIMSETDPAKMNMLGKRVRGYTKEKWENNAKRCLKLVNEAKFLQNPSAKAALLDTGSKILGEASPDLTYGIGMHLTAPSVLETQKWSGKNMMGEILTEIRDSLKNP